MSPMSPAMAGSLPLSHPSTAMSILGHVSLSVCVGMSIEEKKEIFVVELGIGLLAKKTFKEVMPNFACITSV